MEKQRCERCKKLKYNYDMIKLEDNDMVENICNDCFNKEIASDMGIEDFNDYDREYEVCDADDNVHTFRVRKHIARIGIIWEANEIQGEEIKGYRFEVLAQFEEDQKWAIKKLYNKIKKELSQKYIDTHYGKYNTINDDRVKGRIEWSEEGDGRYPNLIVDGKTYTWEELGNMLMGYEGFDFELKFFEQIDQD